MPKVPKISRKKQYNDDEPMSPTGTGEATSPKKFLAEKSPKLQILELYAFLRFKKGAAEKRWREVQAILEARKILKYDASVQLKEVLLAFLKSVSSGETSTISVPDTLRLNIPVAVQEELAQKWVLDVAQSLAAIETEPRSTEEPEPSGWAEQELSRAALPDQKGEQPLRLPERISDAKKYKPGQGIVAFLEHGWPAPFIKAGILTRPDFRRLDPAGEGALQNWLRRNRLPEHLNIPKKSELTDRHVSHLEEEELRRIRKLASALESRERRSGKAKGG